MTGGAACCAAVCCAAAAVWSVLGPPVAVLRLRESGRADRVSGPAGSRVGAAGFAGAAGFVRLSRLVGGSMAAFRGPFEHRGGTALWRAAVISLCDGIGAELRAGRTPETALAEAVAVLDPAVATALRGDGSTGPIDDGPAVAPAAAWPIGIDVPELFERSARRSGAEGLRLLAACWRIGAEQGGTFASVVDGLAGSLREDEAHRQEIAAQLAGPRATAKLLAGLPVLGLVMSTALGARPAAFLLGTVPGALCLVTGVGLDLLGLWWTRRLAGRAETSVRSPGRSTADRWAAVRSRE